MYNNRIVTLIERFEMGIISKNEIDELNEWYESFELAEKLTPNLSTGEKIKVRNQMFSTIKDKINSLS
jgi:hypothetical protein